MRVGEPLDFASVAGRRPWESRPVTYSISAAGCTDRGHRRPDNQDRILCETSADGTTGIFAVADGMGGQRAGAVASAIAIDTVRAELCPLLAKEAPAADQEATAEGRAGAAADRSLTEQVQAAINRCNERILLHAAEHPETRGLGSTLTLALVKGRLAIIANIGDSRTYRIRAGRIESLTRDHSLVAHLAAIGQITPDEVYSHPQRGYIYRALGAEAEPQPDIITERLHNGDVLVLCSDGLWEMVRDDGICSAVDGAASPKDAATQLVRLANGNGGEDNISAIVVQVHET
jgi:serine/threonine protein phosphatase PrpC